MMKCGKRKAKGVYSRKDLEELVKERLGMKPSEWRKLSKEELCRRLGIPWEQQPDATTVVSAQKVCSDRKSKAYPHRYSKEELANLIRSRNPYLKKGKLLKETFQTLCRLANLRYYRLTKEHKQEEKMVRKQVSDKERFFVAPQGAVQATNEDDCLKRSRRVPFQYQKRVLEHFQQHRGLIAVHSLGSGKTMTAVLASQCFLDTHPHGKVLVISPTSLIANFKKEMNQFGPLRHADRYEFFSFQGFFYKYKDHPRQCRDHFLIIDEAHNLRTPYHKSKTGKESGKTTKTIMKCAEKADQVLLLTATPLINKKEDIVPLLNMVRDNPTEDNQYTKKDLRNNLHEMGMCKFSFYEREKLNRDYPHVQQEDVYLPMKPQFYSMYSKVEQELMDEDIMRTFGEGSKLKPFFNGIRRAVNILSELPETDMLKSEKIRWIVDNLRSNPHKKTVIFSHFLESGVEAIQNKLQKEFPDLRMAFITGNKPKKLRAEIVSHYNQDKVDVLFISKAGGEGLDLKGTRQIILMESGWNENTERQVIGRGVRFKSHSHLPQEEQHVMIYRLHHIKKDEPVEEILSPEYKINLKEPSSWPSADLLLKKISQQKFENTQQFLQKLKDLSIEKNAECRRE